LFRADGPTQNCTAVRVRAGVEFDIDIQHRRCWLKWRDSLRCSPVPVVEPHECPERAYGYEHKGHLPPLIEADVLIEPPKQHPTANAEPDRASDELKLAQVHPQTLRHDGDLALFPGVRTGDAALPFAVLIYAKKGYLAHNPSA
jgi:hypothetical protein